MSLISVVVVAPMGATVVFPKLPPWFPRYCYCYRCSIIVATVATIVPLLVVVGVILVGVVPNDGRARQHGGRRL
jgi:hypothetical protein